MRIQHNIMAMSAYRNYTNNVSAMKKNLEKLSSGYKINRAGDDAAGLAISEKMRAQITGLETAQKNAKDGISLVQTAEGALTEVHDMLNRMVELATQSANGTYDNETDRYQLQKEMDQLRAEIDRIADSSNFNGIQLLDGSMDAGGDVTYTSGTFEIPDNHAVAGSGAIQLPAKGTNLGTSTVLHSDAITGNDTNSFAIDLHNTTLAAGATLNIALGGGDTLAIKNTGTTAMTAQQIVDKIKTGSGDVALNGTDLTGASDLKDAALTNLGGKWDITTSGTRITFTQTDDTAVTVPATVTVTGTAAAGGAGAGTGTGTATFTPATTAVVGVTPTVDADTAGNGAVTIKIEQGTDSHATSAAATSGALSGVGFEYDDDSADGNVTIKLVAGSADGASYDKDTNTLTITLDKNANSGKYTQAQLTSAIQAISSVSGDSTGIDCSNIKLTGTLAADVDLTAASDNDAIGDSATLSGGSSASDYVVTLTSDAGTYTETVSNWNGTVTVDGTTDNGVKVVIDTTASPLTDGTESTLGTVAGGNNSTTGGTAMTGDYNVTTTVISTKQDAEAERLASTYFTLKDEMTTEGSQITIGRDTYTFTTDKSKIGKDGYVVYNEGDSLDKKAQLLTKAAENNGTYTVGTSGSGKITITEVPGQTNFDLTTMDGIEKSLGFKTASTNPVDNSKGLTLQIGPTAESFNQLKVNIKDCHVKALGIGDIDISTQDGAQEAVDAIKAAINYVSDVRGTLGATQNRLDHTINNLSVMTENIQDAESTIRDVDVAEEMMAYTKNNILIQSAQAMLAQANQVPQGVLQLLQ